MWGLAPGREARACLAAAARPPAVRPCGRGSRKRGAAARGRRGGAPPPPRRPARPPRLLLPMRKEWSPWPTRARAWAWSRCGKATHRRGRVTPPHRHGRWGGFVSRLFLSFAWRRARHTRGVTASAAPHWAVRGTRGNLDAQGPAAAGTHRNETRVNLADELPCEPIRHAAGRARVQKEGIGAATGGAWTERSGGAVGRSAGGTRPPLPEPVGNSPIPGCAASRPNAASDSRQLAKKQTRRQ